MYMLRAYQSPYSGADCGPQCAQMPNFASRNHSGTRYDFSESRVASNGPEAIEGDWAFARRAPGTPAAASLMACLRVICISFFRDTYGRFSNSYRSMLMGAT